MFANFDPPFDIQEAPDRGEDLVKAFTLVETPGQMSAGYGTHLDITHQGWRLVTRPFCWCDDDVCPYCSGHFDAAEIGISAHEMILLEPKWREAGFVTGHGAPNIWLTNGTSDVRVWWYKYIGRGMEWMHSPDMTWETFTSLLYTLVEAQKDTILFDLHLEKLADILDVDLKEIKDMVGDDVAHAPLVELMIAKLEKGRDAYYDVQKAHSMLTKYSRVPKKTRDGKALGLSWRMEKTLEDPARNIKKPDKKRR